MLLVLAAIHPALADDCGDLRPAEVLITTPPANQTEAVSAPYLHFTPVAQSDHMAVLVWGQVCSGDAARVAKFLGDFHPLTELLFWSPGGNLGEGLAIGEIIRRRHLMTRIRDGETCASACNFMFLGGVIREVEPQGKFMVHMFAPAAFDRLDEETVVMIAHPEIVRKVLEKAGHEVTDSMVVQYAITRHTKAIQQKAAQISSVIAGFLVEMQLSLRFLTAFANIANDEPRVLSQDELKDFNITNDD